MSRHRQDLRAYVFSVARELVERGTIRRVPGQSVSEVIRTEARAVTAEVWDDVIEVGRELGLMAAMSAAQAGSGVLRKGVDSAVGAIEQRIANGIANLFVRKKS